MKTYSVAGNAFPNPDHSIGVILIGLGLSEAGKSFMKTPEFKIKTLQKNTNSTIHPKIYWISLLLD